MMSYDTETGAFTSKAISVPENVEVVDATHDIPSDAYVVPVYLVDQMAEKQGYGAAFWGQGNTNVEYPDDAPDYRRAPGSPERAVRGAIQIAQRESAKLGATMMEWYP